MVAGSAQSASARPRANSAVTPCSADRSSWRASGPTRKVASAGAGAVRPPLPGRRPSCVPDSRRPSSTGLSGAAKGRSARRTLPKASSRAFTAARSGARAVAGLPTASSASAAHISETARANSLRARASPLWATSGASTSSCSPVPLSCSRKKSKDSRMCRWTSARAKDSSRRRTPRTPERTRRSVRASSSRSEGSDTGCGKCALPTLEETSTSASSQCSSRASLRPTPGPSRVLVSLASAQTTSVSPAFMPRARGSRPAVAVAVRPSRARRPEIRPFSKCMPSPWPRASVQRKPRCATPTSSSAEARRATGPGAAGSVRSAAGACSVTRGAPSDRASSCRRTTCPASTVDRRKLPLRSSGKRRLARPSRIASRFWGPPSSAQRTPGAADRTSNRSVE